MNISLDRKLCLPAPRSTAARIEEATAIAMGTSLSAIYFDRPAGRRERMQAEQDGLPIQRPFIAAELALRSGGARHVLFVPQSLQTVLERQLVLRLDGIAVAEINPDWLQLPQDELQALTAQLSDQGVHRLLRVMLTTGASLFTGEAQAGLADAIPQLMEMCNIPALAPVARAEIGGRMLVSYPLPEGARPGTPADAVTLLDRRLSRLKNFDYFAEAKLLHVLLPPNLGAAQIVAFPDAPLRLAGTDGAPGCLPVEAWLHGRTKPCRDWLSACVGASAIAAFGQQIPSGLTEPKITIRHLSSLSTGILYALVLEDPSRVARKLILERQGRQIELTPSHGADGTAMLTGFAKLPGAAQNGETCRIRVLHHSGLARMLVEPPLPAYDGAIPAGFADAWALGADALGPLAQARAGFQRATPPCTTQSFGSALKPALRIITSIGSSADLIRARAALILAEKHAAPVEIVCTMTEGPLAVGARHALAQTAAIYGIPHRLVLFPGFANASERLRAALDCAQDVPAVVLGADILPEGPGWLAFWLRRLRRQDALAAALLASDGAIAATREGDDPCRGLPVAHLPVSGRKSCRPLADCLALGVAGIARLLDAGTPHPDPALWIASALKGSARTETRFPFRRFGPAITPGDFATALAETGFAMLEKDRT